jgi:hypothetical protein
VATDQDKMAIITKEKKEEVLTLPLPPQHPPPLITVLLPITLQTHKEELRITIRKREMAKIIKLRAMHTMKAQTKEDLLIMALKNSRAPKEVELLQTVTQKDIHQAVVPLHSMMILTMKREARRLISIMVRNIIERTTIATGKRWTTQNKRHQ